MQLYRLGAWSTSYSKTVVIWRLAIETLQSALFEGYTIKKTYKNAARFYPLVEVAALARVYSLFTPCEQVPFCPQSPFRWVS